MANLSKIKRDRMLAYIEKLKQEHTDDESIIMFNEIENSLTEKRYGLVFEEHTEAVDEMLQENIPVLTADPKRRICKDKDLPWNFIIEGDNLQALYLLEKTHKGKVDCIYIDPPYNTGAKDWKYNNNFVDGNDAFRHSKWLSLMKKRLELAHTLMKDTGIIVVTIDDYEYAALKLLMDDIFSSDNYLGTILIRNNPSGRSTVKGLSVNHEYALLYEKTSQGKLGRLGHNDAQKARYSEKDENGYFEWENFRKNGTDSDRKDRPKQFYPIFLDTNRMSIRIPEVRWNNESKDYDILEECGQAEIILFPISDKGDEKVWKYGIERATESVRDMLVKKSKTGYEIYRKKYLNSEGSAPHTWWDKPEYSARDSGTRMLTNILGTKNTFDFPKALGAVKDSLLIGNLPKDGIVLDFFAGSGTTMHACNLLNALDGGSRKCILVTNNEVGEATAAELARQGLTPNDAEWKEHGIARKVTWNRTRCAIEGIDITGSPLKGNYLDTDIQMSAGFVANVKFLVCDWVPRNPSEGNLTELLFQHICEMIELENAIEIDGKKFLVVLDEEQADKLEQSWNQYNEIQGIYISRNVLLTTSQNILFNTVPLYTIPDYYFDIEMKEVGETW